MSFRRTVNVGSSELKRYLSFDTRDLYPTQGDVLNAVQHQKGRILDRTQRGVDFQEQAFTKYNDSRPYYYYPNGPTGRRGADLKKQQSQVKRIASRIGRTHAAITRNGLGIRFPSYAAFKLTYLGRTTVDLFGPRTPHMLDSVVMEAGGSTFFKGQNVGLDAMPSTALSGALGIYGQEGNRAAGHNNGTRTLPQRRFFDSSEKDNQAFATDIVNRIQERLRKKYQIQAF